MKFEPTTIPGAYVIKLSPFIDERGTFSRFYCEEELRNIQHNKPIVQINHSVNNERGTVRGLHFQYPPKAEVKIIRCLKGKVFDVIVDLRRGSPTFLKWFSIDLAPEGYNMIYIPEGCAHGFQTLEHHSELLYFHTASYSKELEGGLRFDDPMISIKWPLEIVNVSSKDKSYPLLDASFDGAKIFSS